MDWSHKEDGEIPKAALPWNPQGNRKRGRPKNSWRRSIIKEAGRSWNELRFLAADRQKWKGLRQPMFLEGMMDSIIIIIINVSWQHCCINILYSTLHCTVWCSDMPRKRRVPLYNRTESCCTTWKLCIVPEHIGEVLVFSKLPPYCWLLMCSYTLPEICLKALAWNYPICICSWCATEVFNFVSLRVGRCGLHLHICREMQCVE